MPGYLDRFTGQGRRLRHSLTTRQRFERAVAVMPWKNPVLPVLMHSIERYLSVVQNPSDVDTITRNFFHTTLPLPRQVLQAWVAEWNALPPQVKRKVVPGYLSALTPEKRLSLAILRKNPQAAAGVRRHEVAISDISPKDDHGVPSLSPGLAFIVSGRGFSPVARENTIRIACVTGQELRPVTTVIPTKSTPYTLEAFAPPGLPDGMYAVCAGVRGKPASRPVRAALRGSSEPGPVITSIDPGAQYPGRPIVIGGENFCGGLRIWWRSAAAGSPCTDLSTGDAEIVGGNKMAIADLPGDFVEYPGDYMVALTGSRPSRVLWWQTFRVKPFRYRVEFTTMKWAGTSRSSPREPETIVTRWGISHDGTTAIRQSRNYALSADEPVVEYYRLDSRVFKAGCTAGEVKSQLTIATQLFAWDAKEATAFAEPLEKLGEWIREIDGWDFAASAAPALGFLTAWLSGCPLLLGCTVTGWTARELMEKTGNPSKSFSGTLEFPNADGTGSYTLAFTVIRSED